VRDVVDGLAPGFEPAMAAREMTMTRQYADAVPNVVGDADQLAQVVQNIVDNAIKYGRDGQLVRITVEPAPAGGRWPARAGVLLTVQDEGIGIPRAHLPRLTERFYRVDKGRSRTVGGTGLGLAIVRHIVTRHRGVLQFESHEGAGTTAFVWLPTVAAAATASPTQAAAGPASE
jgi:two-component system phosphate regulon sensor histidine kinase PhoR